jgi:hypothetical protein
VDLGGGVQHFEENVDFPDLSSYTFVKVQDDYMDEMENKDETEIKKSKVA